MNHFSFIGAVAALVVSVPAAAVIIHPGDDPPNALSTPADGVVGQWGTYASVVAISPNHVITTRHQGGGTAAPVFINGVEYDIVSIVNAPGDADFRIIEIQTLGAQPANLTDYVSIYDQTDEVGQTLVVGGFGEGRGSAITGGYEWAGAGSRTHRWGANQVTASQDDVDFETQIQTYTNDVLEATFEGPGLGVFAEATLASGDSGGGWFVNDGGTWKLAGLSQGVTVEDQDNPNQAIYQPAETLSAVRLSSYSAFINSQIPEPGSAALLLAAAAACALRRRRA